MIVNNLSTIYKKISLEDYTSSLFSIECNVRLVEIIIKNVYLKALYQQNDAFFNKNALFS